MPSCKVMNVWDTSVTAGCDYTEDGEPNIRLAGGKAEMRNLNYAIHALAPSLGSPIQCD